jgi:hypothetical protein
MSEKGPDRTIYATDEYGDAAVIIAIPDPDVRKRVKVIADGIELGMTADNARALAWELTKAADAVAGPAPKIVLRQGGEAVEELEWRQ